MIILLQRVLKSSCTVNGKVIGSIGKGLLLLVCAEKSDTPDTVKAAAAKLLKFRVFEDENGKMNLSSLDVKAELLIVSQFTLSADTNSGNRPSFSPAAAPDVAKGYYEQFVEEIRLSGLKVQTGIFGANMKIELINDGPVTFWLQVPKKS